jgi:hypothetical protein
MDFSTTIPFFGGSAAKQLKRKSPKGDFKGLI